MKYNIRINQFAIQNHKFEIDLIDAAILDFFESWIFHGSMQKIDHDGKTYYWLNYNYLISEMPMLGIKSKDGIYRRLKKMCDLDLLIAHPDNQIIGKPFFGFGSKFKLLHFVEPTDEKPKGTDEKSERSGRKTEGGTDEKSDNYIINDNNIILYKGIPLPFQTDEFKNVWTDWIQYRKEIGKKNTIPSIKLQFKEFSEKTENESIAMIRQSIKNGWVGIQDLKDRPSIKTADLSQLVQLMMGTFESYYEIKTTFTFQWNRTQDVEGMIQLSKIFTKRAIEKGIDLSDEVVNNNFNNFLPLIPDYYQKNNLTPESIFNNWNKIITLIMHGKGTNTPGQQSTASQYV